MKRQKLVTSGNTDAICNFLINSMFVQLTFSLNTYLNNCEYGECCYDKANKQNGTLVLKAENGLFTYFTKNFFKY